MNFLAHIYLSGKSEEVIIGNFIGDFVKGSDFRDYPEEIQRGIGLHRKIDEFTDTHEVVRSSTSILRQKYRHYSPVIVDIFYDHFLARSWKEVSDTPLKAFTGWFYSVTDRFRDMIPRRAAHMLKYMKRDNWLYNYQFTEGIDRALTGLASRTTFKSHMEEAVHDLKANYDKFERDFHAFFPDAVAFSQDYLKKNS
ncbi:MAG: ACP phosphodiesterase [Bacteroidota bacterium]